MTHPNRDRLYVYKGCSKHGVKIGISRERGLSGRLMGLRHRCPASKEFAKVWELPNAFDIEQAVIGTLATSGRTVPPGEEWFSVSVYEMLTAVAFFLDMYGPRVEPRLYRVVCGRFSEAAET